jgi:hypothetical protein
MHIIPANSNDGHREIIISFSSSRMNSQTHEQK